MTNKAKPFIKWVGGKGQLLDAIEKQLPADLSKRDAVTYIEPFVGGGAVLFWILQKYSNIERAIINDINPDLVTAYRTVKESPFLLIEKLQEIQSEYLPMDEYSRKEYYLNARTKFNQKEMEAVENTALFIFLNRTCFNGLYRVNAKGLFNVPFGRYDNPKICDKETILADSTLLQKVEIYHGDFSTISDHIDKHSFFYFDPPYKPLSETSSFNSYTKENFGDIEQIRLAEFCKKIDSLGCEFILSNADLKGKDADNDFFDKLYDKFFIKRVLATRMVNADPTKRGKLKELMITNIGLHSTRLQSETFLQIKQETIEG
jgi:DNA adenine methylase